MESRGRQGRNLMEPSFQGATGGILLLALRAVAGCRSRCHVPILQAGEGLERLSEWVGRPYRWVGSMDKGQEAEGLVCAHLRSQRRWDGGAPLFHNPAPPCSMFSGWGGTALRSGGPRGAQSCCCPCPGGLGWGSRGEGGCSATPTPPTPHKAVPDERGLPQESGGAGPRDPGVLAAAAETQHLAPQPAEQEPEVLAGEGPEHPDPPVTWRRCGGSRGTSPSPPPGLFIFWKNRLLREQRRLLPSLGLLGGPCIEAESGPWGPIKTSWGNCWQAPDASGCCRMSGPGGTWGRQWGGGYFRPSGPMAQPPPSMIAGRLQVHLLLPASLSCSPSFLEFLALPKRPQPPSSRGRVF